MAINHEQSLYQWTPHLAVPEVLFNVTYEASLKLLIKKEFWADTLNATCWDTLSFSMLTADRLKEKDVIFPCKYRKYTVMCTHMHKPRTQQCMQPYTHHNSIYLCEDGVSFLIQQLHLYLVGLNDAIGNTGCLPCHYYFISIQLWCTGELHLWRWLTWDIYT